MRDHQPASRSDPIFSDQLIELAYDHGGDVIVDICRAAHDTYARVMSRLNMTLDADTLKRLEKYAVREKMAVAAVARCLLIEAMERREELAHRKKLAADYARGHLDGRTRSKHDQSAYRRDSPR